MEISDLEMALAEREALMNREYGAALDLASFDPAGSILDVATGSGRMLFQLVMRGYTVISGDIDGDAFQRARQRLGELADKPALVTLDARRMDFDDGSFRAVTLANAIHEMEQPRSALDEIRRVLTSDGKLLVIEFTPEGYDLIAMHHEMQGRPEHPRGEMPSREIDSYLRSSFACVESRLFDITTVWVASWKRDE